MFLALFLGCGADAGRFGSEPSDAASDSPAGGDLDPGAEGGVPDQGAGDGDTARDAGADGMVAEDAGVDGMAAEDAGGADGGGGVDGGGDADGAVAEDAGGGPDTGASGDGGIAECDGGSGSECCGDGVCGPGEDCESCAADCACPRDQVCGAGVCTTCGNGACDDIEGEDCESCAADCACPRDQVCGGAVCTTCGNGTCEPGMGEDCSLCGLDCGCPAGQVCAEGACSACGNGTCDAGLGEDCVSCVLDCGCVGGLVCLGGSCQSCGNGSCESASGEDCATCVSDCACTAPDVCSGGSCVGVGCPNGTCDGAETACTCPQDCADAVCGDGCCSGDEVCSTCPGDCGGCPDYPLLVGAGDICSCDPGSVPDEECIATAGLLDAIFPPGTPLSAGRVFTAGDNVYERGTDKEFQDCYDPTWGVHKIRTTPTAGNHEYDTQNARGYFNYFGAAAGDPREGWYAYDLGGWRIYALNSNCWDGIGGCDIGDPQYQWLEADLNANPRLCTAFVWHHARWSSTTRGGRDYTDDFWRLIAAHGGELVLVGHEHNYERFEPLDADGLPDPLGVRQIVVGNGGIGFHPDFVDPPATGSEVRNADTYGVLKVTLEPARYRWEMIPAPSVGGSFADSGVTDCH